MIDWGRVQELKRDFGDEDFLEIVEVFLHEVEASLKTLCADNTDQLKADLHALKGSAANLGFDRFRAACDSAEQTPATLVIADLRSLFVRSKSEFLDGLPSH